MVFYAPVATIVRESKGINIRDVLTLQSLLSIIIVVSEIPCGIIADKIAYKKMLILSNILLFVSKIVFWKLNNFTMLAVEVF
jgi:predicted MFS family arabinose efflux permease